MKISTFALTLMTASLLSQTAFAQQGNTPTLFAAGVISGPADDLSPAFLQDGKTVFFTRGNASTASILVSHLEDGHWTAPEIAPFSGIWNDFEPAMAPDGSYLIFASNRPAKESEKALDGTFNGKTFVGGGGNLWKVSRVGNGWGRLEHLPEAINATSSTFSPSVSADGSIYFMRPDEHTGNFHLFRSQYSNGSYLPAVPLGLGDDTTAEVDPAVAPDESFLVYSANHPGKGDPKRLQITFKQGDHWGPAIDLGDDVNEKGSNIEARLGSDHQTLYFSTNTTPPVSFPHSIQDTEHNLLTMSQWATGRQNIWFVSLKPWIKK